MPTANRSVRFSAEVIYSQRRTLTDCLPQCCVSALWLSVCGQTSPYFSHNVPGRDETRRAGKPSGFVDSVWWTMLDLNQRPPACETPQGISRPSGTEWHWMRLDIPFGTLTLAAPAPDWDRVSPSATANRHYFGTSGSGPRHSHDRSGLVRLLPLWRDAAREPLGSPVGGEMTRAPSRRGRAPPMIGAPALRRPGSNSAKILFPKNLSHGEPSPG